MLVLESVGRDRVARLESSLRQRHRQVRNLRIIPRSDGIELHGEATSFYAKQLVIRDVRASGGLRIRANRIAVEDSHPHSIGIEKGSRILVAAGDDGVLQHYRDHLAGAGFQLDGARLRPGVL